VSSSLRSRASRRILIAGLLALLAFGPGAQAAGAGASTASLRAVAQSVHVVGSGSLNWTVAVRSAPRVDARRIAVLREFRSSYRPQLVLASDELRDAKTGRPTWYRIVVPGRPNGRTGWIPAGAADIRPVRKLIVIDRSERRLELWAGSRRLLGTTVAVGAKGMETPLGLFYVQWKYVPTAPILGAYAFETSAYSKLSDWPGGGIVGVHGTPWPWLLGQAVSHGCVRVHNRDIQRLRSLVPVGTPVKIVA
jgi:lipoprotein-anchoring transpeptidase ErfK/SrfK